MSEQQKWRVLWDGRNWSVLDPKYGWSVHPWTFDAWTDAIHFADQQSRTTEVTLPAPQVVHIIPAAVPDEHPIYVHTEGQLTEISAVASQGRMRINLYRAELEAVALALLAHARKEQHRG